MARYRGMDVDIDDADELRGQEHRARSVMKNHKDGDPDCECWDCLHPEEVEEDDPPFGTAPEDLADDE